MDETVKPGYKTTEFWLTLIQAVSGMLVAVGLFTPDQAGTLVQATTAIIGGVISLVTLLSYIKARKDLKLGSLGLRK